MASEPPKSPDSFNKSLQSRSLSASSTLYSTSNNIFIEAISLREKELRVFVIKAADRFRKYIEEYCLNSLQRRNGFSVQVFCISQCFGWGRLAIDEENMDRILSSLDVGPEFTPMLGAFGAKKFAKEEGYSGCEVSCFENRIRKSDTIATCYMLKYVDRHDDVRDGINPWSIRHAAVFERVYLDSKSVAAIVVRPSEHMSTALAATLEGDSTSVSTRFQKWGAVHILMLTSLGKNWREFINYLDEIESELAQQVILSPIKAERTKTVETISTLQTAMKRVQYISDQVVRARHMIDLNKIVVKDLLAQYQQFREVLGEDFYEFESKMQSIIREHQYLLVNVTGLSERTSKLSDHLRDTINLCNTELMMNNAISTDSSNRAILLISEHTALETRTMKTLTVVALLYAPASFVADFLQMGYLSISDLKPLNLLAEKNLWLFAMFAIPLIITTLSIFFVCEYTGRRAQLRRASKKPDIV